MSMSPVTPDPKKEYAAQNAQDGLVTVADLSVLTGVAVAQLTKFAKTGRLEHFGEYHGKRFFNFQTIVSWAVTPGGDDEAKSVIRQGMELQQQSTDCPYAIEVSPTEDGTQTLVKLLWKIARAAA